MRTKIYSAIMLSHLIVSCGQSKDSASEYLLKIWELPDEAFRMGRGYDADNPEPIRGDCLLDPESMTSVSWVDAQGIASENSETRVTSREDLFRELSISISSKAKIAAFGGSGSFSQYEKFQASDESFTWVFNSKTLVGSRTLKTEKINIESFKDEAKKMILKARSGDESAIKDFNRMCGTQFVRSIQLGGSITEVLEISSQAAESVKEITAKMKAAYGVGPLKVSGNASFGSVFQKAEKNSFLRREFSQTGGDRIKWDLTDENTNQTLDAFVKSLKEQNARVIAVEVVDWYTVLGFKSGDPADAARSLQLNNLLKQLWKYKDHLTKIQTYLDLYSSGVYDFSSDEVTELKNGYQHITEALTSVVEVGTSCYLNSSRCSESVTPVIIRYPELRQRNNGGNRVMQTDQWSVSLPMNVDFHFQSLTDLRFWKMKSLFSGKTADGTDLSLHVDLSEGKCPTSFDFKKAVDEGRILPTFSGEPVYFEESTRENGTPGKKRYTLNIFAKTLDQCLQIGLWGGPTAMSSISVVDDSNIAKSIRSLALSIKKRN
jgi:hypothetical protein